MEFTRPTIATPEPVKILINIGALFDIPTGTFLKGKYGESILNGGLGAITSVVGIGNNFKTTTLDYMMLSAASRLIETSDTDATTYDTEISKHEHRAVGLTQQFYQFKNKNIIQDGIWRITDPTKYSANKWWEATKEYCQAKEKFSLVETPFIGRDLKSLIKIQPITFSQIDSFSEFTTDDVLKIQDENELGDSGNNMLHARQGLAKTKFLMELPTVTNAVYHFVLMTAQIGKEMILASGPMTPQPTKKLQFLKNGDKLKGVTDKFTFLMSNCWYNYNASPLSNQGTKGPEYPLDSNDNIAGDTDLVLISTRNLRSKAGPTGYSLDIIASQSEGILPTLTEFHFIKESGRFGITGTLQHYALDLLPTVSLSRTTVRGKINKDPLLCRAINITSEICQMQQFWNLPPDLICTPKQLYDDLIKLGYDWKILLETRGWYTLKNDQHPVPFLSSMDLLLMRTGVYHPYWLEDDKKTIKKEFNHKKE